MTNDPATRSFAGHLELMALAPIATIEEILAMARSHLAKAPFRPPLREAALLLAHVLRINEAQVLARSREILPESDRQRFERFLGRRLRGEPVAYILGYREFFGRPFLVDSRVLIPRPETEHLVEAALDLPLPPAARIADLGTGSGCLACTLVLERPLARAIATDISPGALAVARLNLRQHAVLDRVQLLATDLAAGLDLGQIDLVISNPPYVAEHEAADLSIEITAFEPRVALLGGPRGERYHRRLLAELAGLGRGTWLLIEIGAQQKSTLGELAGESAFELLEVRNDWAGQPRLAVLRHR